MLAPRAVLAARLVPALRAGVVRPLRRRWKVLAAASASKEAAQQARRGRRRGVAQPAGWCWGPLTPHPPPRQQWHERALSVARASARRLRDVEAMRFAYLAPSPGPAGEPVVVVVAAHLRPASLTRRELLLHCVLLYDSLRGRAFSVVLFGGGVSPPPLPDGSVFSELHAALPPGHREALQAIYCVHCGWALKAWLLALRLSEPTVYSKAVHVASLADLGRRFGAAAPPVPPDHVLALDGERAAAARRGGLLA